MQIGWAAVKGNEYHLFQLTDNPIDTYDNFLAPWAEKGYALFPVYLL